jgi:acetyltransferase-like isoleucine patch superfamily enzyme
MHSVFSVETGERLNVSRDVVLEDRVWLAEGASVQKGVQIGSDCVVAAHAVVTKSFPSNVALGGNPANVIKSGIRWTRRLERVPAQSVQAAE